MTREEQAKGLQQQLDESKKSYRDAINRGCRSASVMGSFANHIANLEKEIKGLTE